MILEFLTEVGTDGSTDNLQAFVVQGALTMKNGAIAVVELIATHRLSEHHLKS